MSAYVYILTNPAMPGLAKIGITEDLGDRLRSLFSTGVPLPFEVEVLVKVDEKARAAEIEKALHQVLPGRVHERREFFRVDAERVKPILALLGKVCEAPSGTADATDAKAVQKYRRRRPVLNFETMGIPIGAELDGAGESRAKVISDRKVEYNGEEMYLTNATRRDRGFKTDRGPCSYWSWDGRLLSELYAATHGPAMLPGDEETDAAEEE